MPTHTSHHIGWFRSIREYYFSDVPENHRAPSTIVSADDTMSDEAGEAVRRPAVSYIAGWSSPVAREAHNLEVSGSNPLPATFSKSRRVLDDLDQLTDPRAVEVNDADPMLRAWVSARGGSRRLAYLDFVPRPDLFDEQHSFVYNRDQVSFTLKWNGSGGSCCAAHKTALFLLSWQAPPRRDTPFWIISNSYEQTCGVAWTEKLFGDGHRVVPSGLSGWVGHASKAVKGRIALLGTVAIGQSSNQHPLTQRNSDGRLQTAGVDNGTVHRGGHVRCRARNGRSIPHSHRFFPPRCHNLNHPRMKVENRFLVAG